MELKICPKCGKVISYNSHFGTYLCTCGYELKSKEKESKFKLYKIYYGDNLVYLGRTKQPLQTRIRNHIFKQPMHRTLFIDQITKIEYAEFNSEADMNVYEVYYINLYKPPLNCDDKAKDRLTINLPEVEWKPFYTDLWNKWKSETAKRAEQYQMKIQEIATYNELKRVMRRKKCNGEITEDEYYDFLEQNKEFEKL